MMEKNPCRTREEQKLRGSVQNLQQPTGHVVEYNRICSEAAKDMLVEPVTVVVIDSGYLGVSGSRLPADGKYIGNGPGSPDLLLQASRGRKSKGIPT